MWSNASCYKVSGQYEGPEENIEDKKRLKGINNKAKFFTGRGSEIQRILKSLKCWESKWI